MTWPGESLALDYAQPIDGAIASFGDPMRYRAGSDTLAAGTSFLAGFYDIRVIDDYPDEDVTASVVLVLGAATSGTVRVSYGVDPDFAIDNPALATQDLGTHVISGATELALPVTSFDKTGLLAFDHEQLAFVEILAGAVEVVQIKFRLWPPEGVSGAWVPGPAVSRESSTTRIGANLPATGGASGFDLEAAYSDAVAEWSASGGVSSANLLPGFTVEGETWGGIAIGGAVSQGLDDLVEFSTCEIESAAIWVNAPDHGETVTTLAGATLYHPDEVWLEPGGAVRNPDGSPATWQFVSWTRDAAIDGYIITGGPPYAGTVSASGSSPQPPTTITSPSPLTVEFTPPIYPAPPASSSYGGGTVSLSLPVSPQVVIRFGSWTWQTRSATMVPISTFVDGARADIQVRVPNDLRAVVQASGYVYWDPEAMADEIPLRIRQRGDGLGMGGPRVRGIGSRQRSPRVRGYV